MDFLCIFATTNKQKPLNTENMKTWNIYLTEYVYTKREDGNGHRDYIMLKKIAGGLEDFTKDCWPIIDNLKKEILANTLGSWEGPLSRGEDWCNDSLFRPATDEDKVRDYMFPNFVNIEIVTTPYTLELKQSE